MLQTLRILQIRLQRTGRFSSRNLALVLLNIWRIFGDLRPPIGREQALACFGLTIFCLSTHPCEPDPGTGEAIEGLFLERGPNVMER